MHVADGRRLMWEFSAFAGKEPKSTGGIKFEDF